jgi:hypothetical protein
MPFIVMTTVSRLTNAHLWPTDLIIARHDTHPLYATLTFAAHATTVYLVSSFPFTIIFSPFLLAHKPPLSLSHLPYIITTSYFLLPNRNTSHFTHYLFIPVSFPYGKAGVSLALLHSDNIGK